MAPTAGQIYSDHSASIEEKLNRSVGVFLPQVDPFYRKVWDGKLGEGNTSDIGRDMKVIKTFVGTFAGVIDQGAASGDFTLYGDGNGSADLLGKTAQQRIRFNNPTNPWPDPADGPNAQPVQMAFGMRSAYTSIGITLGEMQAEAHPSYIVDVINPKMMGFARNMAHTIASCLYLSQNDNYRLVTLSSGTWSLVDSNTALQIVPDNLATDRFAVGMRLNIVNASDGNSALHVNTTGGAVSTMIVTMVDELTNTVQLRHRTNSALNGTTTFTEALANGDYLVLPGSRAGANSFRLFSGLNSWIKTGDTTVANNGDTRLLGAEADSSRYLDVNEWTEFKSLKKNLQGQVLTEHYLKRVLRLWHNAKAKHNQTIDMLLWADGIDLAMQQQMIGRETIDRTSRLGSMRHLGQDNGEGPGVGMKFVFDGRSYEAWTSRHVESGAVYGTKVGNRNWKQYAPPPPKGVEKSDKLSFAPFYFVGKALGSSSNIMPYYSTSGNTSLPLEMVQMPGMIRMNVCPDQPAGMKLENVAEQRLWADN